jgi:hypothetical protein
VSLQRRHCVGQLSTRLLQLVGQFALLKRQLRQALFEVVSLFLCLTETLDLSGQLECRKRIGRSDKKETHVPNKRTKRKQKSPLTEAKPRSHHALSVCNFVLEAIDFGITKVLLKHKAKPRLLSSVECGAESGGVLRSGGAQLVHLAP